MGVAPRLDDLVQSVTLYRQLGLIWHLYVLPFVALYAIWLYVWCFVYGFWEHYEGGFVVLAVLGCIHILCCLACYWSVHVQCFCTCKQVQDVRNANVVKVVPTPNNGCTELVRLYAGAYGDATDVPWFMFQQTKYMYDVEKKTFRGLEFPIHNTFSHYLGWTGYRDDIDWHGAVKLYGSNEQDMVVPEFRELFKERATAPFFVFQMFCVGLWCMDSYWYYSVFTLVMLVLFECTLVQQQLRNMSEIRKMGNKPYNIQVYRNRRWRSTSTNGLVPGDLISIVRSQKDNLVPCDVVLLRGSCIVDESMLTGESVPQMKEPLDAHVGSEPLEKMCLDPNDVDSKLHVLFGGTKVVQHTGPPKTGPGLRAGDNGCVAYVLRTGFNTAQGKLLRTILFGVKRVSANNRETFGFIMFLLVFALAAAWYVWTKGVQDPTRNRYQLFLECTLILTSVIPPELPIELSLAVNTSLLALARLGVYCTEPFRIPFAGKVDICCFDKTGTLTSDDLIVEGVALAQDSSEMVAVKSIEIVDISQAPDEAIQVLATCHSLVQLDDGLVGDPLEKATMSAIDWVVTKADAVVPKRGKMTSLKIFQRYHFSSSLRRMAVVAGYTPMGTSETIYIGAVKGAPEVLKSMFRTVPQQYEAVHLELARRGARVLALGIKTIGRLSTQQLREMSRDTVECGLNFVGFVIISCPLKADSKAAMREIQSASHRVVMITGDNPLTACHVARELRMAYKPILVLTPPHRYHDSKEKIGNSPQSSSWMWESIDESEQFSLEDAANDWDRIIRDHDLCLTGDGLQYLQTCEKGGVRLLAQILPRVRVFARFAPKQKEFVVVHLKASGFTILMCGDGTNDVGALKHADVGVAILSKMPESAPIVPETPTLKQLTQESRTVQTPPHLRDRVRVTRDTNKFHEQGEKLRANLEKMMKDLDEKQVVKLGDASVASPFTSELASIMCVCHIIKQGRCTLVTTLQMFKILALNALILAYTHSVLYLDGIKLRDFQATLQGLLLAGCFLFISRSKPLRTLSKQRPLPNIFNFYTIMTVLLQFSVHFVCLIFLVQQAKSRMPASSKDVLLPSLNDHVLDTTTAAPPTTVSAATMLTAPPPFTTTPAPLDTTSEEEDKFEPNIINSTVYIVSMALQIVTFAINYRGRPYMEGLRENKGLLYSILGSGGLVLLLCIGWAPELSEQFEVILFPAEFQVLLLQVFLADVVIAFLADRACLWLCGEGKLRLR